jgi:hypothetical protein
MKTDENRSLSAHCADIRPRKGAGHPRLHTRLIWFVEIPHLTVVVQSMIEVDHVEEDK